MSAPPRISCVILCHNYGRYLDQAITSCMEQEPGNFILQEIIVIDDGSNDETEEVCLRHKDDVKVIRRQRQGFAQTLTDAFLLATGDWVALLDADDWFHPSKLRTCAEAMAGGALFIEHWENVVDSDGNPMVKEPHPGGNTSTLVVHREAARSLLPAANEIFFHALREAGHGIVLSTPSTFYRIHPRSMTDRSTPGVSQDYRAEVCTALADRLQAMRGDPPDWATSRRLQRISLHFRTIALGHQIESTMQRGRRLPAMLLIPGMLISTLRARDSIAPWLRSLSSVITGRPIVRLNARQ
ncbi:glycosyltransferase [Streptomyces sp. NBC_00138]|uniref:glycosyltransferase family 2 protein n=1 Tax=Streptomyces sp. NBC_00138 TaxID=2903625 RepID=UPI003250FFC2